MQPTPPERRLARRNSSEPAKTPKPGNSCSNFALFAGERVRSPRRPQRREAVVAIVEEPAAVLHKEGGMGLERGAQRREKGGVDTAGLGRGRNGHYTLAGR